MSASSTDAAKRQMALERTALIAQDTQVEIASTAAAAQVKAMVEARFVMAVKRPRNMEQVRQNLIKECSRPSFALEDVEGKGNSALYRRPVGGGTTIEGLGIRFAEVAIRCLTNVMAGSLTVQEDGSQRIKYCFVLDLETNDSWEDTVHVSKTVERRVAKESDVILSSRTNSTGQTVYTILASEDALATKEAALVSKKLRTLALRLVPGDLQDECIETIKTVRRKRITEDPDAAMRRVVDGMARQNITVTMLEEYLNHPVAQISSQEIVNLQSLYAALRDGETTWAEIMSNHDEGKEKETNTTKARGVDAIKAQVRQEKVADTPTPAQPPAPPAKAEPPQPQIEQTQEAAPPVQQAQSTAQPTWSTQQPQETTQPVAPESAAPVTEAPKGKVIKGIQFPLVMTRQPDNSDAWTPEQLQRAETALEIVNQKLGKSTKLSKTIYNWFQIDLDQLNGEAMEAIITLLQNWK